MVLKLLVGEDHVMSSDEHVTGLQDHHVALVENIYESAILQLRLFYKVCMCVCVCIHTISYVCVPLSLSTCSLSTCWSVSV